MFRWPFINHFATIYKIRINSFSCYFSARFFLSRKLLHLRNISSFCDTTCTKINWKTAELQKCDQFFSLKNQKHVQLWANFKAKFNPLQPADVFRGYRKATPGWNVLNCDSIELKIWWITISCDHTTVNCKPLTYNAVT